MNELEPLTCHCVVSRQLTRHISKIYERHLAPSGITATQLAILSLIEHHKELTMNELADLLLMDRTTLLRALKPLQLLECLISTRHPDEPRRHMFSLSQSGSLKIQEAKPLWEAAQIEYETDIGPEHARALRSDMLSITGGI
ncbi:MarR family transcriptional regulator [Paenibacillus psychroresistens]|uniref:MarR family transcriptional regulator n=1 Tax=Paenibacillus psychroresistens TaxID=1778678 RepID=A0A6B8RNS3_9BACL|nr:MarR family winged helix-turn-helix transcriptional regulator [Paenibacillus psychroresistens]QGQ97362.1 MarR family transcriptional regulator [Paenibacillus psychroresistens]